MTKVNRDIENPFIIRMNVKDRNGQLRKISLSPALFTAVVVIGRKQKIPVSGQQIVKQIAKRLSPADAVSKSSFSRLVQDELILCLVELLGGDDLKDEIVHELYRVEINFSLNA